jgi:pyruvate,water dikinase
MINTITLLQSLDECREKSLAGGKAVNLGILIRAGFTVPDGFCITTDAYRYWAGTKSEEIPADLTDEITRAYRAMGSPSVAVRSSATAEDMSEASMAGQYDTFLDIADEDSLLNRIRCCWASLDSPRTRAYLKEHGIELSQVAMAVVVQRLVPSDVAGVLFTANPQTGSKNEMLVEASWGLGEAVVSGLVQPDVLRIDSETGRVVHARIADKQVYIPPAKGSAAGPSDHQEHPVPEAMRRIPSVKGPDVTGLWKLGLQAASHFGRPQDIEWAIHDGKLYLLQSRPITTLEEAEAYEQLLTSTRARLRELVPQNRGPWVVHNISETLPHPTPLTWSVVKRFMSGAGGFGAMYRQAGFEPSPQVCRDGFLTLIAGKPYMDASLASEMFFEGFPFKYDIEQLKNNPDAAQNPPTIPSGSMSARAKMARKAGAASAAVHALSNYFDKQLNEKLIPEFVAWVTEEKSRDLTSLTNDQLIELWHAREKRIMDEFAPQSLLPSLISGAALAELKSFLAESFWDEDPDQLATLLSSAHEPDETVKANIALYDLAQHLPPSPASANNTSLAQNPSPLVGEGQGESVPSSLDAWLKDYGHRAPEEFDLATPRWRERPEDLVTMALRLKDGKNPADLHHAHQKKCEDKLQQLRAHLSPADQSDLDARLALARRYMPFREDGKYYLMQGYDLLRDLALEIGRRLEIGDDVFLLTLEELFDALNIGFAPTHLLAQRKIQRRAEKRIPLPHVIDAANIDDIGSPPKINRDGAMPAFAISPGGATGPARIVRSPAEAGDLGDRYILVCPSTDPSWTPLFTNAAGLILECGGTLSHGAVVAREMSIPAVVLRDACTLLHDGDMITVDGRNGTVSRAATTPSTPSPASAQQLSSAQTASPLVGEGRGEGSSDSSFILQPSSLSSDPHDLRIDHALLPPPPGRKERQSASLRNIFLLIWGVYLAAAFLLPEYLLYQPSLSFLDVFLWPLVRIFGKPGAVALIAAGLGALTMVGQKYLTDNHRLRIAKQRATRLQDLSNELPAESARGDLMWKLAAPVQMRVVMASFVPLAVLLGPLVMIFMWFEPRVAPAAWNAPPGTPVTVVAMVRPGKVDTITLDVPAPLTLAQPATQQVPDIAAALTEYREKEMKPSDLSALPWELKEQAERFRDQKLKDLADYLKDIPPVPVSWNVIAPDKTAGAWPITVRASSAKTLSATLVLGDAHPPSPAEIDNTPNDPLTSLKLIYQPINTQSKIFFAPIAHHDWGWLWVYLLAYLPAMYLFRYLLRIA